ncbi:MULTISPECIES: hypothetical protein [Aeromicrobium]|uniref:hypothetical protein n=1 Tax=Aeromicrobium TaxID=2040 RepID=UPI00257F42E9|nr:MULTISPECIES: hypothetical protein [Aeromicrobium]
MCNPTMWTTRYLDTATARLGWDLEEAPDGDLLVVTQAGRFVIANTAPHDPEFLHVYALYAAPSEGDRAQLLEVANEVTLRAKGVSVSLLQRTTSVVFAHQGLVGAPDSLPTADQLVAALPRVQRMLSHAVSLWFEKLDAAGDAAVLAGIEAATRAAHADGSDG